MSEIVTAGILVIGDEILSGRTKDKNIGFIAEYLTNIGIDLKEVRVVADDEADIVAALNALRNRYTYVFTTGGIGPTHDDITADSVAKAFGVDIHHHPEVVARFRERWTEQDLNEARLRMARVPAGADLIPNRMSGAPGIRIENLFLMAGVPSITAGMLDALTGELEGGAPLLSETIGSWVQESEIADLLRETERVHEGCAIGSYPFFREGRVGANFVVRSTEPAVIEAAVEALATGLRALGREAVPGGV